jgi:hypothetical protein
MKRGLTSMVASGEVAGGIVDRFLAAGKRGYLHLKLVSAHDAGQ